MIGIEDRKPTSVARILRGVFILAVILLIGTSGYMLIEKWSFFDSLYMTVITITTVGFHEVRKVSNGGRLFTIVIIFLGMGIIAYIVGMAAQAMVDLQVRSILGRRKLGLKIRSLKDQDTYGGDRQQP